MKILMATSSYPLFPGDGTAPFIEEIARRLAGRGHEIDIVLPAHPRLRGREIDSPGVRLHPFRYAPHPSLSVWGFAQSLQADVGFKWRTLAVTPFAAFATRRAFARAAAARRYDIAHAHWVIPNAALVAGIARRRGLPFVVSLHGSDIAVAERGPLFAAAARRAFQAAHCVTACSSDLKTRATALGAARDSTRVLPYGVDVEFFSPGGPGPDVRKRLGAGDGDVLVVAVGRLVEKKGFDKLIGAAAGLDHVSVAIMGDGDLEPELRARTRDSGARVFFAGRGSREDIRSALRAADVAVVPSVVDSRGNVDGLPNALLEAMAAGAPIIASQVGGIPDVARNGVEARLVPPGDVMALRVALAELRDDPTLRRRLGASARARAVQELTWPRLAAALEETYASARTLAESPRN
jgi:glycosyltransferase involved in cell wall biosynthesis